MSNLMWKNNAPTENAIRYYTRGDCWLLAFYLAKHTGNKIALIGGLESWGHACLSLGEKKYLDIEGIQTGTQLLNHKNGYTRRSPEFYYHSLNGQTLRQYKYYLDNSHFCESKIERIYNPSIRVAESTAKKLIKKYLG